MGWSRGGQRKRWPPTIRSSLVRSFTYSLSSLVSILSPLCVLLIYRAAGKCLRHSPRSYNPSLSCSSYFSTFVSLAATFYSLRRPFPLRTFCTLLCRPSTVDPSLPSSSRIYWLTLTIKNPRAESTRKKEGVSVESIANGNMPRSKNNRIYRLKWGEKMYRSTDRDFY